MLVTSLLPLLARYSLGFDLLAGPDKTVTLTIIPRKADPKSPALEASETRPISITAIRPEPLRQHTDPAANAGPVAALPPGSRAPAAEEN